jgi:hypothetical protein
MAFSITAWAGTTETAHYAPGSPIRHGKLVKNLEKLSAAIPSR